MFHSPRGDQPSQEPIRLSEVVPNARYVVGNDMLGRGVQTVACECRAGDIFVARIHEDGDGHDEVSEAIARGVSGVVAERVVPTFGVPLAIVRNSQAAFARISQALAGHPSRRLRVIAVTGTSGKTTTAWITASILSEAGVAVGVLSDLGCLDGEGCVPEPAGGAGESLEDPRVLARWLRRLSDSGCTHAVVEVSSRMLAASVLSGVLCETVAVTNLASAHLDLHGTAAAYHRIKRRILACMTPDGCLVTNGDDRRLAKLAAMHEGPGVAAALVNEADVSASPVERSLHGQTFLLSHAGSLVPVAVTTPVASFARNAVVAAGVAVRYGIPLERVARGIESAGMVTGRVERFACGQDFAAFLDRPTSRHQVASTLSGLRHLTNGRLVALLGERVAGDLRGIGSGDRSKSSMGVVPLLEQWCDEVMLVPRGVGTTAMGRVGRMLESLGEGDCLVVFDEPPGTWDDPTDPSGEPMPLVFLVEAWLRSAASKAPPAAGRRAA